MNDTNHGESLVSVVCMMCWSLVCCVLREVPALMFVMCNTFEEDYESVSRERLLFFRV